MTLDEAIKHYEKVTKEDDDSAKEFYRVSKLETHPDRKCAEVLYVECKKCAKEHRQLAEWLKELKDYRERIPSYEAGYNDAKREIALSGEYKRAYDRGYEQACKDKIDIPYNAERASVDCGNTKCDNCANHNYCDYEPNSR